MNRVDWVSQTWAALSRGDLGPLRESLAESAQWRAVEDGPWNCQDKVMIVDALHFRLAHGLSGTIEDVLEDGNRLVVGFRPDNPDPDGWPLDNGVRYLVITLTGEKVTEIKGCTDRRAALNYVSAR